MQEPLRLVGALIQRRFKYFFPVDEEGKEIGLDDWKAWQIELYQALGEEIEAEQQPLLFAGFFFLDLHNCGLTDKEVNEKVTNITRKHLKTDCGGVFWGTVSNDNWETYKKP